MTLANKISPYLRLMRLHQPVGIWLLLWPCWWGLALAGMQTLSHMLLFLIGAVVMRSAGCIVNDLADRNFDAEVERTKTRPLASGEITPPQALALLAFLLIIAACIAIMLGTFVFTLAAASLVLVATYPFMKRVTYWPQLFLGFTFNWGALLGYGAATGTLQLPALLLYAGGVFWTLGYDTIYGHQDKADDLRIGVKSTALLFREHTKPVVALFYAFAIMLWAAAGNIAGLGIAYYVALALTALHFMSQIRALNINSPAACLKIFRANAPLGLLLFLGAILTNF